MTTQPVLIIEDLRFSYPAEPWSLDIERLHLAAGEQLLLTAPSGRGKSTLLHLIAGLIDPQRGRVLVGGTDIHTLRGAARDRHRGRTIGMIFQTFNLLHGFSAMENILAALLFSDVPRREHNPRAVELLERLGIERPGAPADELSIGQQQRVAVARAIAAGPALVLADEPTASLDPENAVAAMDLIQGACARSGAALLCTSHDPAIVHRFGRRADLASLAPGKRGAA